MKTEISYIIAILLILIAASGDSFAGTVINHLFPDYRVNYLVNAQGQEVTRITQRFAPDLESKKREYWNINKAGRIYTYEKAYMKAEGWVVATTGVLFFGNDGSLIELGDIRPKSKNSEVLGYQGDNGQPTGLYWVAPGGADYRLKMRKMDVLINNVNHQQHTYSASRLVEPLGDCRLEAGSQEVFHNCVHIVMYHGSNYNGKIKPKVKVRQYEATSVPYRNFEGYTTNALEWWVAEGYGIIKVSSPYVTKAQYFNR